MWSIQLAIPVLWLSFIACGALFGPSFVPEDRSAVRESLTETFGMETSPERLGLPKRAVNATVQTVSFCCVRALRLRGA